MKKFCIIFVLLLIIMVTATGCMIGAQEEKGTEVTEYFRIHIRANSNGVEDQKVKYLVRDEVVKSLTPILCECEDKREAMEAIGENLPLIERAASEVLKRYGFSYGARARLSKEEFPLRVYDKITLPSGVYDSVILSLGRGEGDNWWCVIYPPLCFTGGEDIRYRSKIWEIIERFST